MKKTSEVLSPTSRISYSFTNLLRWYAFCTLADRSQVRGGKSKVKIEERKTDQSKRAHFRLKLIVMKEKVSSSILVPLTICSSIRAERSLLPLWWTPELSSLSIATGILKSSNGAVVCRNPITSKYSKAAPIGMTSSARYPTKFVSVRFLERVSMDPSTNASLLIVCLVAYPANTRLGSGTQHIHGVNCKSQKHSEGAAKVFSMASDSEAHDNFLNEVNMLRWAVYSDTSPISLANWEPTQIP